ncbi:MAG: type II toxin-antitoxin system PemK/MazF family toxin [Cyanobacteria bacterium P01_C01_bin.89]
MAPYPKRFSVYLVALDPTVGTEMQKTRPCVVVSPNEINSELQTVIVAPMTTQYRDYPTRIDCHFEGKDAQIALDQIRTCDRKRLYKKLGVIDRRTRREICDLLVEMFEE